MNAHSMLIEAQMHLECMAEVLNEMNRGEEVCRDCQRAAYPELSARLWACLHVVQSLRIGREDAALEAALVEARRYDTAGNPPQK